MQKKKNKAFSIFYFVFGLILFLPSSSYAACTNPAGVEGEIFYNADQNAPQVCAGSTWFPLGKLNPSAGGSGCSNPTGTEGQMFYNADFHVPQYCDGDDWRPMINFIGGAPHTAMNFVDQTGVALSTVIESNIELYDSTGAGASVTISGGGSPAYRICSDATCSGAPAYTSAAGMVSDGDYLQLRLTSSPASLTTFTGTLGIGIVSYDWDVTTTGNRIVFATSQTYDGDLNGVAGAHSKCQTLASAAGLLGTYKAWISSDAADDPESTHAQSTYDYWLLDGTIIANGWTDLTDGTIDNPINRDENNVGVTGDVWTNTTTAGLNVGSVDCVNWTDNTGANTGVHGRSTNSNSTWANVGSIGCPNLQRLYCFEQ